MGTVKCYVCYDKFEWGKDILGTPSGWVCPNCHTTNSTHCESDDPINSPPHYKFGQYEVWDILTEWLKNAPINQVSAMAWYQCMKYLFRFPAKGKAQNDLLKARWYFDKLLGEYDE